LFNWQPEKTKQSSHCHFFCNPCVHLIIQNIIVCLLALGKNIIYLYKFVLGIYSWQRLEYNFRSSSFSEIFLFVCEDSIYFEISGISNTFIPSDFSSVRVSVLIFYI